MNSAMVAMLALSLGDSTSAGNEIVVSRVRNHMAALAKSDNLSGVILIAKDDKTLFEQAYGFANVADRIPNSLNTKFSMASMGKMITAVAVMQLVQAGKISLKGKVGSYLPTFPNQAVREQVTIEHLLTHTSGMGNFWIEIAGKAKDQFSSVSDYVPLFANQPLQFKPGEGFAYSNNGYTVLGLVIEAASGKSYFEYVKKHIYKPAGMANTDAYELNVPVPRMALGYSRVADIPGKIVSNIYSNVFRGGPAGGSYTTARDLLKFSRALTGNKLLTKANTEILTSGKVPYGARRYAYGFAEESINGHRLIGHGGGAEGIANELLIFTDLGYTVAILTNGDVENFWEVQAFIKQEILGPSPSTDSYFFTKRLIASAISNGYDSGVKLLKAAPSSVRARGGLFEQIGYKLLWQQKTSQAIDIFRLYVLAIPNDAYAYLGLGKAYESSRDTAKALEAYRKYLSLEPDDPDIKARIQKLGG